MTGCAALAFAFGAAGPVPVAAAVVAFGRHLASECLTCHRPAAGSAIPNIFGMPAATFAEVVRAYRAGRLSNAVMRTIASRLADEEIDALAAYFETTRKP